MLKHHIIFLFFITCTYHFTVSPMEEKPRHTVKRSLSLPKTLEVRRFKLPSNIKKEKKGCPQKSSQTFASIEKLDHPIAFAVQKNDLDSVQAYLTLSHVDPNLPGENGNTALHDAVILGHNAIAHELLKCERVVASLRNNAGLTPHHLAKDGTDIKYDIFKKMRLEQLVFEYLTNDSVSHYDSECIAECILVNLDTDNKTQATYQPLPEEAIQSSYITTKHIHAMLEFWEKNEIPTLYQFHMMNSFK